MRRLAVLLCCLPLPALAQQPPLAVLGPLVVLGPRCNKRPDDWGQRLDLALADALRPTQGEPEQAEPGQGEPEHGEPGLLDLAQTELNALHEWQADPAKACATVQDDALQQADRLVAPNPAE